MNPPTISWRERFNNVDDAKASVFSGIKRLHKNLKSGKSLGIVSTFGQDDDTNRETIKRIRYLGYSPVQATGPTIRFLIVPPNKIGETDEEHSRPCGASSGRDVAKGSLFPDLRS